VNRLFGIIDQLVTAVERTQQLIDEVDALPTAFQQLDNGRPLTLGGLVERHDSVSAVRVERAQNTHARLTLVAVETHRLLLV